MQVETVLESFTPRAQEEKFDAILIEQIEYVAELRRMSAHLATYSLSFPAASHVQSGDEYLNPPTKKWVEDFIATAELIRDDAASPRSYVDHPKWLSGLTYGSSISLQDIAEAAACSTISPAVREAGLRVLAGAADGGNAEELLKFFDARAHGEKDFYTRACLVELFGAVAARVSNPDITKRAFDYASAIVQREEPDMWPEMLTPLADFAKITTLGVTPVLNALTVLEQDKRGISRDVSHSLMRTRQSLQKD